MPKANEELRKKMGGRVKQLLREHGMKQAELAEKIYCTPEHLNAILNGKRTLTFEMAQRIANVFPPIRCEWILCMDDFKAEIDKQLYPIAKHLLDKVRQKRAVCAFLGEFGLSMEINDEGLSSTATETTDNFWGSTNEEQESTLAEIMDRLDSRRAFALKESNGEALGYFSDSDRRRFIAEICDFFEFKLNKLIDGDENNG